MTEERRIPHRCGYRLFFDDLCDQRVDHQRIRIAAQPALRFQRVDSIERGEAEQLHELVDIDLPEIEPCPHAQDDHALLIQPCQIEQLADDLFRAFAERMMIPDVVQLFLAQRKDAAAADTLSRLFQREVGWQRSDAPSVQAPAYARERA